ncbi:MAG: hypothetical protein ACPHO4_07190 [Longimicrobiales bacterium]
MLVGACVGLMVIAAIVDRITGRLKIPFTVALVVAGAALGALADRWTALEPTGALEVTPEAVFFVVLPTLIFQCFREGQRQLDAPTHCVHDRADQSGGRSGGRER